MNPDAASIAAALDEERRAKGPRGPLHGIPVLLKDNVDTADRMTTTAGSLALAGSSRARATPSSRSGCARRGRCSSARPTSASGRTSARPAPSSGWSARGGQCRNPYALDRNPCGSSSGSGAAVSANLCARGRRHRDRRLDRLPVHRQRDRRDQADARPGEPRRASSPSPTARTRPGRWRARCATPRCCSARWPGHDPRDPATARGRGARRGRLHALPRPGGPRGARASAWRARSSASTTASTRLMEEALAEMSAAGRGARRPGGDPARSANTTTASWRCCSTSSRPTSNAYLADAGAAGAACRTLADLIAFNEAHRARGDAVLRPGAVPAGAGEGAADRRPAYLEALAKNRRLSRAEGHRRGAWTSTGWTPWWRPRAARPG